MQFRARCAAALLVVMMSVACGSGRPRSAAGAGGGGSTTTMDAGLGGGDAGGLSNEGGPSNEGGLPADGGAAEGGTLARCVPSATQTCRAMWVWTTPDNQTLVDFAKAHGVQEIFYSVSPNIAGAELSRLQDLRTRTRAAGIVLDALGGDSSWATTAVADAITWENDATATGLFDGIHLDIEPAQLPDWDTNRAADAAAFISAMQAIRANDTHVHLELDCQFSYGTIPVTAYVSLADALVTTVDEITIMSYRNTDTGSNGMFGISEYELLRGQAAGITVRLGAEASADTPAEVTFYGMTDTAMAAVLAQTDTSAAGYPTYRGIAVEDYAGWSALAP